MNKNLTSFLKILILAVSFSALINPINALAQPGITTPTADSLEEPREEWRNLPIYITEGINNPFLLNEVQLEDFRDATSRPLENPYPNSSLSIQMSSLTADQNKIEAFMSKTASWGNNNQGAYADTFATNAPLNQYLTHRRSEITTLKLRVNVDLLREQADTARTAGNNTEADRLESDANSLETDAEERTNQDDQNRDDNIQYLQGTLNNLTQEADRGVCVSLTAGMDIDACMANAIDAFYGIIIFLFSLLLWLVDSLFSTIIKLTIVDFGALLESLDVVDKGWKVTRDLANIFFIFILLYLAITTALQAPGGDTRKILVNIIIIALVINFSAVFTRVAIDASNITSLTFYNLLGKEGETPDLSAYFRNSLSWFETRIVDPNSSVLPGTNSNTARIANQTLAALAKNSGILILIVITIFTLLVASVLLLIRSVSLIILIIVSPLAFLGYGFKPLSEIFNKWLDRLKCDVLFAPLFFFLLYLTLSLFENTYGVREGRVSDDFIEQIIMFLMLNGLMLGSIMIAQKVGCQMGGKAFNFVTNRSKQSLGAMSGFAGRNSLGFLASKAQKSQTLKNLAAKAPRTGWAASTIAQKVSGYGFGSGFGSDKKDGGLGYTQRTEQRQKRQAEQLKLLKDPKQRAEYLSNLQRKAVTIRGKTFLSASNEDAKKQFGDLPDREKANMRINAIDNENTELIEVLDGLQDTLKGEKKESADKEYEKQLRQYLKVATKDFTDKSGNKVNKGDQLTTAQQLERFAELGTIFAKNKNTPTPEELKKGKKIQEEAYLSLSDIDKVALREGLKSTLTDLGKIETEVNDLEARIRASGNIPTPAQQSYIDASRVQLQEVPKLTDWRDNLESLENDYIKGRGETEQKFREEEEKLKKQNQKRALEESKRVSKEVINNIFKNIPTSSVPGHTLNPTEINELKKAISKLNVGDVANLDNTILQNQFVIERLSRQALTKIIANTDHIETNTLKIIQDYVTDPLNKPKLDDQNAPKAFD